MKIEDKTKYQVPTILKQILEDGFEEIKKSELINCLVYGKGDRRTLYNQEKDERLLTYKVQ